MNDMVVDWGAGVAFAILALGIVLSLIRLIRGPSTPDRIVALDLIATLMIGFVAVFTVASGDPVYLRVAVVIALVSFVGTAAVSNYLERQGEE